MVQLDFMRANAYVFYFTVTSSVAILVYLLVRRWINQTKARLRRVLKDRDDFSTLETESPLDDQEKRWRHMGVESIETRFRMAHRIAIPVVGVLWGVAVIMPLLQQLPAALVSFILGIITVVLGMAARPLIENVIAGLVISFSQPLRIGDTIKLDGNWGTVEDISLIYTRIKIWDWRRYIVPNGQLLSKEIVNYSLVDSYQWAYTEFTVAYGSDIGLVRELAVEAAETSDHFSDYEEPAFWVMGMDAGGIRCWVAGWADSPNAAWLLTHDVRTALAIGFQKNGIEAFSYQHRLSSKAPGVLPGVPD